MFLNRSSDRYRRLPRRGVRLLSALAPLALAVVLVVPAVAQAGPQWFINGIRAGSEREEVEMWGNLQFQSSQLGKMACHMNGSGSVWNESEKGLGLMDFFNTGACIVEPNVCPEGGIFVTAEEPVYLVKEGSGTEKFYKPKRGLSSLPWPEELSENTEKKHRLTIRNMKLTTAVPCLGLEVPMEGTLEANYVNGTKNGLSPSHWRIGGEERKCVCFIIRPGEAAGATGEATVVGSGVQLVTAK
jgi:hypothetical protein